MLFEYYITSISIYESSVFCWITKIDHFFSPAELILGKEFIIYTRKFGLLSNVGPRWSSLLHKARADPACFHSSGWIQHRSVAIRDDLGWAPVTGQYRPH
jgi:hypothetical protein